MRPLPRLVEVAKQYIDVHEKYFDSLKKKKEIARSIELKDPKMPWCTQFVLHCVNMVSKEFGAKTILSPGIKVLEVWNKTNEYFRFDRPEYGSIILWHQYKNGMGTGQGHMAIVTENVDEYTIRTVEGVTVGKDHQVLSKLRNIRPGDTQFRLLGFLNAWNLEEMELQSSIKRRKRNVRIS